MLKQRILTAIILIPLFIAAVYWLSPGWFALLTGAVVLWGAVEWSFLMGIKKFPNYLIYPALMLVTLFASLFLWLPGVMMAALAWWLSATILVLLYPKASDSWGKGVLIRSGMGLFVLVPPWLAINALRSAYGSSTLIYLFLLIWGADVGAYFAGRKWGKNKLAPAVSPGKTREGLYGALAVTLIIALSVLPFASLSRHTIVFAISLSLLTVLFSIVGDLFESMLKRKEGLKDSGHLLPGHGGILDRIDSLTAAAPVFVLGWMYLWKV